MTVGVAYYDSCNFIARMLFRDAYWRSCLFTYVLLFCFNLYTMFSALCHTCLLCQCSVSLIY